MQPSITAIVCAYNEEETLSDVLHSLSLTPLISEIIVIDDGSADKTASVLEAFGNLPHVHPIWFPKNRGKGYAMAEGIQRATGEILVFVDADLVRLEQEHIASMVHPLLRGEADMVIGYPSRGGQAFLDAINVFRPLAGQRAVFRRDILPLVPQIRTSRFGVETLINLNYRQEAKRVRYVRLDGVLHPVKLEKYSPAKALQMYGQEGAQIIGAVAHNYVLPIVGLGIQSQWTYSGDECDSPLCSGRPGRFSDSSRQVAEALRSWRAWDAFRKWPSRRQCIQQLPRAATPSGILNRLRIKRSNSATRREMPES